MSNQSAHINMLKYSIEKIENVEDYDKKLDFLNDFKEKEIIDQETYVELKDYLDKKLTNIGLRKI